MKPVLQALILAERIFVEQTGRCIIAGTFNGLKLKQRAPQPLVTACGPPWAYISLTDVCDRTTISLQFVNLSKNKIEFWKEIELSCNDRLATIEFVEQLPYLPVTEAGVYAFEIVCEGEVIGSHRIVAELEEAEHSNDGD